MLPQLLPSDWLYLAVASAGIGFSKSGFPGVSMLHVAVFAMIFEAKLSTGVLLPMLIFGDVCAITFFGRRAVWSQIRRLLPPTLVGIVAGWYLMDRLPTSIFRMAVAAIILILTAIQAYRMFGRTRDPAGESGVGGESEGGTLGAKSADAPKQSEGGFRRWGLAIVLGFLAGMTTMMANAAGPVVALYLLTVRLPKWELIGTAAWLFLVLNICKLPFSYNLGLINGSTLSIGMMLAAMIPIGMTLGSYLVGRISQRAFDALLLAFTAVMAIAVGRG